MQNFRIDRAFLYFSHDFYWIGCSLLLIIRLDADTHKGRPEAIFARPLVCSPTSPHHLPAEVWTAEPEKSLGGVVHVTDLYPHRL